MVLQNPSIHSFIFPQNPLNPFQGHVKLQWQTPDTVDQTTCHLTLSWSGVVLSADAFASTGPIILMVLKSQAVITPNWQQSSTFYSDCDSHCQKDGLSRASLLRSEVQTQMSSPTPLPEITYLSWWSLHVPPLDGDLYPRENPSKNRTCFVFETKQWTIFCPARMRLINAQGQVSNQLLFWNYPEPFS